VHHGEGPLPLLIVGVLGGGILHGPLSVVCEPREGLCSRVVVQKSGVRHLHDSHLGSMVVWHGFVLPLCRLVVQKSAARHLHDSRLGSVVVCHGFVLP
jgi:hypothetical protein